MLAYTEYLWFSHPHHLSYNTQTAERGSLWGPTYSTTPIKCAERNLRHNLAWFTSAVCKQAAVYSISWAIFAWNNKATKELYYPLMNAGVDTDEPAHILDVLR